MLSTVLMSFGIIMTDLLLVGAAAHLPDTGQRSWAILGGSVSHLALYLCVCSLPAAAGYVLAAALPLVALALLSREVRLRGGAGGAATGPVPAAAPGEPGTSARPGARVKDSGAGRGPRARDARRPGPPVPAGYLAAFLVISFAVNHMRGVTLGLPGPEGFSDAATIVLTLAFVALACAVEYVHGVWRSSSVMPLAAVAYVTAAVLVVVNGLPWAELARALVFASFFIYVTVFYRVAVERARLDRPRLVLVAASVFVSNSLGLSLGSATYVLSQTAGGAETAGGTVGGLALILAYLVFIAGTFLQFYLQGQGSRMLPHEAGARGAGAGGAALPNIPAPAGPDAPTGMPSSEGGENTAAGSLPDRLDQACDSLAGACGLTPREGEVLRLLARQLTYLQVADEMGVSPNTAKSHIRHVYQKLDVHSGSELFALVLDGAQGHGGLGR